MFLNYETLLRDVKEDLNKGRMCFWIQRFHTVVRSFLSRWICRFKVIQVKNPASFYAEIDKLIWEFIWKWKGPITAKHLWKRNLGDLTAPNFEIYNARVIKMVWYRHGDAYLHQCNRIKHSQTDPYAWNQFISNNAGKNNFLNTWWWTTIFRHENLDLRPETKVNLKWATDLNAHWNYKPCKRKQSIKT